MAAAKKRNRRAALNAQSSDQRSLIAAGGGGEPPDPRDPSRGEKNKNYNPKRKKHKAHAGFNDLLPRHRVIKVNNVKEFYQTKFGRTLKGNVQKTNRTFQGQRIYEVTKKIPGTYLKKGDQLYLDGLHKDHIEVFRENGNFKTVINLDGKIN